MMQRPLGEWSVADVAMLLKELNIAQYADKFTSSAITGSVLANLNTLDLMQALRMDWMHAKRLQRRYFCLITAAAFMNNLLACLNGVLMTRVNGWFS